ncbi:MULTISPECIES: TfoX/Sxy family protein [Vibrio]|uniref:TfoX/Sxy family protein n=1 Tax=Vibrio TaxID=662 RepID=UPI00354D4658
MDGMSVIQRVQLSGTITTQPMFSGVGYFIDGAMFGIDFDGLFYVKANGALIQQCKQAGWLPYVCRNNQTIVTNYYALPEEYLYCPERLHSLITQVVAFAKFGIQSRLEKKERPNKPGRSPQYASVYRSVVKADRDNERRGIERSWSRSSVCMDP